MKTWRVTAENWSTFLQSHSYIILKPPRATNQRQCRAVHMFRKGSSASKPPTPSAGTQPTTAASTRCSLATPPLGVVRHRGSAHVVGATPTKTTSVPRPAYTGRQIRGPSSSRSNKRPTDLDPCRPDMPRRASASVPQLTVAIPSSWGIGGATDDPRWLVASLVQACLPVQLKPCPRVVLSSGFSRRYPPHSQPNPVGQKA